MELELLGFTGEERGKKENEIRRQRQQLEEARRSFGKGRNKNDDLAMGASIEEFVTPPYFAEIERGKAEADRAEQLVGVCSESGL